MANKPRALRFETNEAGCHVIVSHKLNQDGYFRKRWADGTAEMFHRTMWRVRNGEIPKGMEIDHKCGNRACCNTDHLRLVERNEHLVHTNRTRYSQRKGEAYEYWLDNPRVTGTALAEHFGVTFGAGCRWIREFRKMRLQEIRND